MCTLKLEKERRIYLLVVMVVVYGFREIPPEQTMLVNKMIIREDDFFAHAIKIWRTMESYRSI